MNAPSSLPPITKLPTGIAGFDLISSGGVPQGRTTLISGTAGSAKTVFATQFLAEGIRQWQQSGVLVTFEETPDDLRRNMASFGWEIAAWEQEGRLVFVDCSPNPSEETLIIGAYDLNALLSRIVHAVQKVGAKRVVLDSLGAIFSQYSDPLIIRNEMLRVSATLKELGVTTLVTTERIQEYGEIARYGVEEFVADNVIILRNVLEEEKRRRTVEILKFRGTVHQRGEFPFTLLTGQGLVVLPLSAIELQQRSSNVRTTSGIPALDTMCGGGFFRDSILLVSGATGTGKTLITTSFLEGGAKQGERSLLFAFEESREQLIRNARGWGIDFEAREREGTLKIVCEYPEARSLEDHLIVMKETIQDYKPARIAVDSLSAMERAAGSKVFREFVISLTSFIKHQEVVGLFTATTPTLHGGESVTETHISTLTDSILLLRYVELYGEMRRGITVLKMRGSLHDKNIFEFLIDETGLHIGKPFRNVSGILSGSLSVFTNEETERIAGLFTE